VGGRASLILSYALPGHENKYRLYPFESINLTISPSRVSPRNNRILALRIGAGSSLVDSKQSRGWRRFSLGASTTNTVAHHLFSPEETVPLPRHQRHLLLARRQPAIRESYILHPAVREEPVSPTGKDHRSNLRVAKGIVCFDWVEAVGSGATCANNLKRSDL
jgi:hypothetical protein